MTALRAFHPHVSRHVSPSSHRERERIDRWLAVYDGSYTVGDTTVAFERQNTAIVKTQQHRTFLHLSSQQPADSVYPKALLFPPPYIDVDDDAETITLIAAPSGQNTFYYADTPAGTIYSTNFHDICRIARLSSPDEHMLAEFLLRGRTIGTDWSRTFVKGVTRIPPGQARTLSRSTIAMELYWQPSSLAGAQKRLPEGLHDVRQAMTHSIERHLGPNDSVGIFFSGGLDSSTLAALSVRLLNDANKVRLYSLDSSVSTKAEVALRRYLAASLGIALVELPLPQSTDLVSSWRHLNRTSSSPIISLLIEGDQALAESAAQSGVTIMFSGDGGEELFQTKRIALSDTLRQRHIKGSLNFLAYLNASNDDLLRTIITWGVYPLLAHLANEQQWLIAREFSSHLVNKLPSPYRVSTDLYQLFGQFFEEWRSEVETAVHRDHHSRVKQGWLLNDYESYMDLLSAPAQVTDLPLRAGGTMVVRAPLLDPEIFSAITDIRLIDRAHVDMQSFTKQILRKVTQGLLPDPVRVHPKTNVSDLFWRVCRHHQREVTDLHNSPSLSKLGIIPNPNFDQLRDFPERKWGMHYMLMLALGIWLDELDAEVSSA